MGLNLHPLFPSVHDDLLAGADEARALFAHAVERSFELLLGLDAPGEVAADANRHDALAIDDAAQLADGGAETAAARITVSAKLRERLGHLEPDAVRAWAARAAADWLAATARAGDRIGFAVVGDLAKCVRVLEREPDAANRTLELVWSSVTEEVLAVRGRVENWVAESDVIESEPRP